MSIDLPNQSSTLTSLMPSIAPKVLDNLYIPRPLGEPPTLNYGIHDQFDHIQLVTLKQVADKLFFVIDDVAPPVLQPRPRRAYAVVTTTQELCVLRAARIMRIMHLAPLRQSQKISSGVCCEEHDAPGMHLASCAPLA